uniref:Uncharacterized protein n=1 Tax=Anguilla anguilla TaxID=7936 RepID=A0A0E9SZ97_ANGAN
MTLSAPLMPHQNKQPPKHRKRLVGTHQA